MSQDPNMIKAYLEGKDLYAMIAQAAFNNRYEDNLEFYPEGTELEIDGEKVVSGSGKEFEVTTDENNNIKVKYYELLETPDGDKVAKDLQIGDPILSDIGQLTICNKVQNNDEISFTFNI